MERVAGRSFSAAGGAAHAEPTARVPNAATIPTRIDRRFVAMPLTSRAPTILGQAALEWLNRT